MSQFLAIATDVDGTLLTSGHELRESTVEALNAAIDRGIPVILCTGKSRGSWYEEVERRLKVKGFPAVLLQGLLVVDGEGETVHSVTLSPASVLSLIAFAKEKELSLALYTSTRILVERYTERVQALLPYREPVPEAVGDLSLYVKEKGIEVNKAVFLLKDGDEAKRVRPSLETLLSSDPVSLTQALDWAIEILPERVNKSVGLSLALSLLKISPERVIAFGDGENDIEMLGLVGLGCAMGNAMESVKKRAKMIVPSNDEDGLSLTVRKLVLGET